MQINGKLVIDRELNKNIYEELIKDGFQEVMARIYAGRNSHPTSYLDNSLLKKEDLHHAMSAGELIGQHIMKGDKFALAFDYDSDGIGSGSIVYKAIKSFGGDVVGYVPNREIDGYGLNKKIVQKAHADGCKCLITVDMGIVAFDAILEAKRLDLNTIITDHHMVDSSFRLPEANIIVNPMAERGSNVFGSKNLCGAGVAWYVVGAVKDYLNKQGWKHDFMMKSVIDLTCFSTVSDMVKIDDNNRKIIRYGLQKMNSEHINLGLRSLLEVSNKSDIDITTSTISFLLAPLVNSCGRLGSADKALTLLTTENEAEALTIANELKATNEERKQIQKQMTEIALDTLDMDVKQHSVIVFNPTFKEGVVGLTATKVKDLTNKPTGVFALNHEGQLKGSFRSIPGVNIRDVLDLVAKKNSSLGLVFGGHSASAGARLLADKLDVFKQLFDESVKELSDEHAFNPTLMVDGELTEADLTFELVEEIMQEHWGQGFTSPLFRGEIIIKDQKILNGAHCKFSARIGRMEIDGIFFGRDYALPDKCNMVFTVDINSWKGNKKIQMIVNGIEEVNGKLI